MVQNSHILLNGVDSDDIYNNLSETVQESTERPAEVMAKQMVTRSQMIRSQGLSQKQVVRMQGPLRKFKLSDEAAEDMDEKQEQRFVRQRIQSSNRYFAIPKIREHRERAKSQPKMKLEKKGAWKNDKEYRTIKQLDRKREIISLSARLGVRATSVCVLLFE